MALFTASDLRRKGAQIVANAPQRTYLRKSAGVLLEESAKFDNTTKEFDIFLSHAFLDAEVVLGLKHEIEDMGFSVYVDWIEDAEMDRTVVDKRTAAWLRARMKLSKSLFFAISENSEKSKWMPWECGYFDGLKDKVAICPVAESSMKYEYKGQEYLGLYPYVQKAVPQGGTAPTLWIYETPTKYIIFRAWLDGSKPSERG